MKNVWLILILGLILRLFLSFATIHPDLAAINYGGKIIASGDILNLYEHNSPEMVLNYPPLIYIFFGFFNLILSGAIWLFKLPYIIFDLLIGFLLMKLVDERKSVLAFGIWIFNPVSLYSTYMMGQFDIIPTFFSILSIFLALKNRLNWSALALGMGLAFKLYPIFFIIPLLLLETGLWKRLKLLILSILPYLVSILPYLFSHSFITNAFLASQSSKSLYAAIPVSGGESIFLFPLFLIIFYLLILQKAGNSLWKLYLIPLLLFFAFTHFHPQWLIWLTPFFVLDLVKEKFRNVVPISLILISWVGSLFFFDSSLTIGIFAPIFPFLINTSDVWTLLNINIDYNFSRSVLQTLLAASSFYLIKENV